MWMLGAGVNVQFAYLLAAEGVARDHALDGLDDDTLWMLALEDRADSPLTDAARIAGVSVILLVRHLAAGKLHLSRVNNDDIVTAIDVRRINRFVLTP